jgi:hypothetical protein
MRNDALKSLTACLNHESQTWRGASVINDTVWRTTGQTAVSRSGGARLGGKASALISSPSPPQSQTPPTF